MYYEEQWVDGALCWRTSPTGAWTRYTANELAHRYESAEKRAADAQATVEALQQDRDALFAARDMWKREAYLISDALRPLCGLSEYEFGWKPAVKIIADKLAALDAEREKVRTVEHELARIVKRNQGGYIGDRIAIDKCLTIIRTLDATTPAGGVVAGKGLYQGNGEAT